MYNKQESEIKKATRDKIFNVLKKTVPLGQPGFAITLPNTSSYLEKLILDNYRCTLLRCYENDPEVIKEANYPSWQHVINEDIFEANLPKDVSFLYLDLCNMFTTKKVNQIIELLQRTYFAPNALVAITLATTGRNSRNEYENYYKNYEGEGFVKHIGQFLNSENAEVIYYSCFDISRKSLPMATYLFKIKND